MISCYECPRCKDQPGKTDYNGNHFAICGMSGNMVYLKPRKERRHNGKGWISFSASSCGLYRTFDDAFNAMTKTEQKRWRKNRQITLEELLKGGQV